MEEVVADRPAQVVEILKGIGGHIQNRISRRSFLIKVTSISIYLAIQLHYLHSNEVDVEFSIAKTGKAGS